MRALRKHIGVITAVAGLALVLSACSAPAGAGFTTNPLDTPVTSPPNIVRGSPAWSPHLIHGPTWSPGSIPPTAAAALGRAKQWIVSATPPPRAEVLPAAPAGMPDAAAPSPACDWLVRATTWWSVTGTHMAATAAWLEAHPDDGLTVTSVVTDAGTATRVVESSPDDAHDLVRFTIMPGGGDRTVVRVDATTVPADARCVAPGTGPTR